METSDLVIQETDYFPAIDNQSNININDKNYFSHWTEQVSFQKCYQS